MVVQNAADPAWLAVRKAIARRIESGDFAGSPRLPSERVLCKEFSVSSITIRRALHELAREGRIERRQGIGTFVRQAGAPADFTGSSAPEPRMPSVLNVGIVCNREDVTQPEALALFQLAIFLQVRDEVASRGGSLQLLRLSEILGGPESLLRAAHAKGLGAVALLGQFPVSTLKDVARAGLPAVQIDDAPPDSPLDAVVLDQRRGARQAVELLYALGHRRFGMVRSLKSDPGCPGSLIESPGSSERHAGFGAELASLGLDANAAPQLQGELGAYDWVPAVEAMLGGTATPMGADASKPNSAPTAILLSDIHFVAETVRAAERLGRTVPKDLTLVSFGVQGCLAGFRPTPALVTFDAAALAAAVADRLEARARAGGARVIRRIPMRLEPGESIGPAR